MTAKLTSANYAKARKGMIIMLILMIILVVGLIHVPKQLSTSSIPYEMTESRVPRNVSIDWHVPVWRPPLPDDNELQGKSCQSDTKQWTCRDCGLDQEFTVWEGCPLVQRSPNCELSHNRIRYDSPMARSTSYLGSASLQSVNILTHYGLLGVDYHQVPCSPDLTDCFNLTRCQSSRHLPVPVFPHGPRAKSFVSMAAKKYPDSVQLVTNPSQACLFVVLCDSYQSAQAMRNNSIWNLGINHFIWRAHRCFDAHPDRPFGPVDYGLASISLPGFMDANVRKGYDMPIAFTKQFNVPSSVKQLVNQMMGYSRKWLVSFKGNINNWPQVWWQHRWLAANYWNQTDPRVAIDMTCDKKTNYSDKYPDYIQLLVNSTFAFCPGGGAPQSYRFMEALALGAIPVVTPDLVPPFYPDIDWTGCVVRVSESRIIDLPRLLDQISKEEVQIRQKRCLHLFEKTIGWLPQPHKNQTWTIDIEEQAFMTSMKIWSWRIQNALQKQQARNNLEQGLV